MATKFLQLYCVNSKKVEIWDTLVLTQTMHVSIPVSFGKLRGSKHDFLEKSVGGCSSYDLTAPGSDLNRSFFCQAAQRMPHNYA